MLEYRPQTIGSSSAVFAGLAMLTLAQAGSYPVKDIVEMSNGKAHRSGIIDTSSQLDALFFASENYLDKSYSVLASAAESFNTIMLSQSTTLGAEFSQVLEDNFWDLLIR